MLEVTMMWEDFCSPAENLREEARVDCSDRSDHPQDLVEAMEADALSFRHHFQTVQRRTEEDLKEEVGVT